MRRGLSPEEGVPHELGASGAASTKEMVCPHCQTKGSVTTRKVLSRPSAAGDVGALAILTAGLSLLGSWLSRQQAVTQAWCGHCGVSWTIS